MTMDLEFPYLLKNIYEKFQVNSHACGLIAGRPGIKIFLTAEIRQNK